MAGHRTAGLNARRAAAPPVAPGLPVWRRGDEWTYRWAGPDGSGTDVWSIDREEVVDGIDCYVTRSGRREILHRKIDLASVNETFVGEPASRYSPPRLNYVWPPAIGKSWEQSYTEERRCEKQTHDSRWSWEIEREESVPVPAGTFRTVKITIRDARNAAVVSETWYAPAARLPSASCSTCRRAGPRVAHPVPDRVALASVPSCDDPFRRTECGTAPSGETGSLSAKWLK